MRKILTALLLIACMFGALQLGTTFPILGSSISAILLGAIIRHTPLYDQLDKQVTGIVEKYFLKTGIVLLGFTLSMRVVAEVGIGIVLLLAAVVAGSIAVSQIANKFLKLPKKLALLLGIGTSICGGSAIVATAPILEAENEDIAVSVTTMLIYSLVALVVLPIIGNALNFTDPQYGVLAGAAVNDTASVVATSFEWSDEAGGIATIVKLTRTLFLVPVTIGVILYQIRVTASASATKIDAKQIISIIPVFVVLFVLAVTIASVVTIPPNVEDLISKASKYFMTIALVSIGLGVYVKDIIKAGFKPILLGLLCWGTVTIVSIIFINILY